MRNISTWGFSVHVLLGLSFSMLLLGCPPSSVMAPDVVGLTRSVAGSEITAAQLSVGAVIEEYSATIPSPCVISQNPIAGTSVSPGSTVALVVSKGPEPVNVPDVIGSTQSAASSTIGAAGLSVGTVTEQYSATVPATQVISQNPTAGASVLPGSAVALWVSKGPEPATVPDVVDLPESEAVTAIEAADLTAGAVTYEIDDTVVSGNVLEQSPVADALVAPGSAVSLMVARYVVIPDVGNMTEAEGIAALEAKDLVVGNVIETSSVLIAEGKVIECVPCFGEIVAPASSVDLYVSTGTDLLATVAAGLFEMGDPSGLGVSYERPVHDVTLSAYQIGIYQVTNQEYAEILNWANTQGYLTIASASTVLAYGLELLDVDNARCQITWDGTQFVVDTRDTYSMADHPVVTVSWYGAAVYCNWLSEHQGLQPCYDTSTWACDLSQNGYHLPTEAQWERAAAWGDATHYTYGNASNSISVAEATYDDSNPLALSNFPYTTPVGYYASVMSPEGCYDMSGNVWEWCGDWFGTYPSEAQTDPTGVATGWGRILRGGGYSDDASSCRTSFRFAMSPETMNGDAGFRVARTL